MVDLLRIPCCCFLPLRYVSQLGGITSVAVGRSSSLELSYCTELLVTCLLDVPATLPSVCFLLN